MTGTLNQRHLTHSVLQEQLRSRKLIEKRQHIPTNEFPIPLKELCERFEKLYTGCVNDVMREACLLDQNLPHEIMPLRDEMTVCGEAFTVKSAPNCMIEGEMTFRAQMLDDFKPNGVVVWDTSADVEASLWGGVMTATAKTKGIRGAVVTVTAGGRTYTETVLTPKGEGEKRLSWADLEIKFRQCAEGMADSGQVADIIARIRAIQPSCSYTKLV